MSRAVALAVLGFAALNSAGARGGECRGLVRPLLLTTVAETSALAAARAICEREASSADADALYQLALFDLGLAGNWQPDLAVPRITAAAAAGIPEAQYWLAWQHEAGPLLDHDAGVALGWYQRAAGANHRLALARLAQAYEAGELGLPRDASRAAEYRARQARCLTPSVAGAP
jgi:TPR repeat protein